MLTRQMNDLTAIEQRRRNRVKRVCGTDKQDMTEVDRDIQIMVIERVVLLRIEHFEQCRRGISMEIVMSNFIYFIPVRI
jgi:hypothetical protein